LIPPLLYYPCATPYSPMGFPIHPCVPLLLSCPLLPQACLVFQLDYRPAAAGGAGGWSTLLTQVSTSFLLPPALYSRPSLPLASALLACLHACVLFFTPTQLPAFPAILALSFSTIPNTTLYSLSHTFLVSHFFRSHIITLTHRMLPRWLRA
jgi:hypothetical protein